MMAGFIELAGVSKSFGTPAARRDVLEGVSLSVERGEFVSIVGSMGSGKSTLLNIAAGLLAPDRGTVRVGDRSVSRNGSGAGPNAALVFQNYSLLPWFSALENVRLAVQAGKPGYLKHLPRIEAYLRRNLEQPALSELKAWYGTHLPKLYAGQEPTQQEPAPDETDPA